MIKNLPEGFTQVEVASTDGRQFVEAILKLGKAGGALTKECPVFKGLMLRAIVVIPDTAQIPQSNIIRVLPKEAKAESVVAKKPGRQKKTETKSEEISE